MTPAGPLLEATAVYRVYPGPPAVRAVDGVSVAVGRGEVLVVTGPSGSGKTTLLGLLGALEPPSAGRVAFAGTDLTRCSGAELARVRRRLGFVFQDFGLIPAMTAADNVTYPLIPRGVPRGERRRRAAEWLGRLGLGTRLAAPAGRLSGGEQQRVAIARALAGNPEALLADEPTSGLDTDTANLFLTVLNEFRAAGGAAVIATHDPRLIAAALGRREMEAGRLL